MNKRSKLPSLEESLTEITLLIEDMENGDLSLEKSLHNFERGITLIKHCQSLLQSAEQKVQILMQNNSQQKLDSYESPEE